MRKYILPVLICLSLAVSAYAEESCMGTYLLGKKIAYSILKIDPDYLNGKPVVNEYLVSLVRFEMLGVKMGAFDSATTYRDEDGKVLRVVNRSEQSGGGYTLTEADFTDSEVKCKVTTKDGESEHVLPIPDDKPFGIDVVSLYLKEKNKTEKVYEYNDFNPLKAEITAKRDTLSYLGKEEIRICGENLLCDKVKSVGKNGDETINYVYDGKPVRTESQAGTLVIVKEPMESRKNFDETLDLMKESFSESDTELGTPFDITEMTFVIRDKITGSEETKTTKAVIFDPEKSVNYPVEGKKFREYLKKTTLLDIDNPEIIDFAKKATEGAATAYEACEKLREAVHNHMIFEDSGIQFQRAGDILKNKRGVCRHTALLYTALARSLGIPCRQVDGLAYMPGTKAFGGHAWVECYVGEWVPFDPTWNTPFVDATHIPLGHDDKDLSVSIFNYEIKVLNTVRLK